MSPSERNTRWRAVQYWSMYEGVPFPNYLDRHFWRSFGHPGVCDRCGRRSDGYGGPVSDGLNPEACVPCLTFVLDDLVGLIELIEEQK